jgi:Na+/H+ antiporter NhaC
MWMAVFILLMTWSMQDICQNLGTAEYLIDLLGDSMPVWTLPLFTFVVASMMSFATGTSWGAMGILIPIILPLSYSMGTFDAGGSILFFLTAAAILDGAIFGDHCSPISDTTVLTSISTGCDHIAHVKTQLPYAVVTMALAGLFGYLAVAGNMPLWLFYVLFPLASVGILFVFGRRIPSQADKGGA